MLITRSHIKLAWETCSETVDYMAGLYKRLLSNSTVLQLQFPCSTNDSGPNKSSEFSAQKKKRHRRTNFKFYTRMHDWKHVFNVDCPHNLHATAAVCEMRRKAPSRGFCNSWQDRQEKHKSDCVCNRKRWLNIELFAGRFCSFYSCRIKVRLVEGILVL